MFCADVVLPHTSGFFYGKFKNTLGIQRVSLFIGDGERQGAICWCLELIPGPTCIPTLQNCQGVAIYIRILPDMEYKIFDDAQ